LCLHSAVGGNRGLYRRHPGHRLHHHDDLRRDDPQRQHRGYDQRRESVGSSFYPNFESGDHNVKATLSCSVRYINDHYASPSPRAWVAEQVERYESSGGTEALTLRDTGLPVIIVTNRGWKTGAIRKTPLMRVTDGRNYILVASQGGAPKHPLWYHNLKADPN